MVDRNPEQVVREFFACYSEGRPDDFADVVGEDYTDYGHTPPGRGVQGAKDDYEHAVQQSGGLIAYTIDALVGDESVVSAAWTAHLPNGSTMKGLSQYTVADARIRSTRHALIDPGAS